MKISVQFEADSAEEYDSIIAALSGPGRSMFHVKHVEAAPVEPVKGTDEEIPAPIVPPEPKVEAPAPTQAAPMPGFQRPQPVAAQVPKVEKPKRGRPKAQPVTEAPVTVHVEPAKEPDPVRAEHTNGVSRVDLIEVFNEYIRRYGANFGMTDVPRLLQKYVGEGIRKASDVPDSALAAAVAAIRTAIADNPFNRKVDYA